MVVGAGPGLDGGPGRPARPYGLRAALQQDYLLPGAAGRDGPFDVLRCPVVVADPAADVGQRPDLPVVQAGHVAQWWRHISQAHPWRARIPLMMAQLGGHCPLHDLPGYLAHHIGVGRHLPADDGRSQPPARLHHDPHGEPVFGYPLMPPVGTYRRHQGISEDGLAMGVVVQVMVDPRCAGVLFTRSPVTGDTSVIVVEASWGLGSAVVSGEVTPDTYV